jgi:hypothetical protein
MRIVETSLATANASLGDLAACRARRRLVGLAACLIFVFGAMPATAQTTTIVDVGSGGILPECPPLQQFCYSVLPAITPDARFVAFESTVPTLVTGPQVVEPQIYLHDRDTCTTTRLSETASGQPGDSSSSSAAISADGTIVLFQSSATNLVAGASGLQLYAYDAATTSIELISRSETGVMGNNISGSASISADGRWITYVSLASNLVPGDTNASRDIFLYDRDIGSTQIVSRAVSGLLGDNQSNRAHVSGNGRFITFDSLASNLDPAPTNGAYQSYLLDRDVDGNGVFDEPGTTSLTRVSINNDGASGNSSSTWAVATDDGLKVAFASDATNLVPGDSNARTDIFVRNLATGETTRESVGPGGAQTSAGTYFPLRFSADGRYLTFHSGAPELAFGLNGKTHVFRRDLSTGENVVVSRDAFGDLANDSSEVGIISADGQTVFFDSLGRDMIPGGIPGDAGTPRVHVYAREFSPRVDPCGITPNPWNDIVIPINDSNPFNVTPTASVFTVPVPDNGEIVIGVSFEGTIYINPTSFPGLPAQTQLTVTNPSLVPYVIGGTPPAGTPWDFQNQTGTVDVTYRHGVGGDAWSGDGLPDFALPDAAAGGNWQFSFRRVGGAANPRWSDVTITLHTVAPPTIDIQPESLSVTTIPGGTVDETLTIANPGGMDVNWEVRTATSECSLPAWVDIDPTNGIVAPGDLEIATVTFDATGMGLGVHEANLCIGSNDAAHPMVLVPLTLAVVEPPAPELAFEPRALDFGNVQVGQTSPAQAVMLVNTGSAVATGVAFQSPGSGFSVTSSTCGASLQPGASCESLITFTPAASGPVGATWTASSNQGAMTSLDLSGTGTAPVLQFDPTSLDFGDVPVGTTSTSQTASLKNVGTGVATGITFSSLDSGFSVLSSTCGTSLAPGASCESFIAFTPAASGVFGATWTASSDQGAMATLDLSGTGTSPILQFDPLSLDFGDVAIGTTSAPQSATLRNTGSGSATGLAFSVPGSGFNADFSSCGSSLAAGASCVVTVTFTPMANLMVDEVIHATINEGKAAELHLTGNGVIGDLLFQHGFE